MLKTVNTTTRRREADYRLNRVVLLEKSLEQANQTIHEIKQRLVEQGVVDLEMQLLQHQGTRDKLQRELDLEKLSYRAALKYRNLW